MTPAGCRMLIVSNIPNPYNDALFARLARQPGLELHVAYCAEREANRSWKLPRQKGYSYDILKGVRIGGLGTLNVGVFLLLRRFRPGVVVVTGSYAYPTMQLLAWWLTLRGLPWYYWSEELTWNDKGAIGNFVRDLFRRPLKRARGILAIGRRSADSFRKLGIPSAAIRLFHYYADTAHFELPAEERDRRRSATRQKQHLPADATVILYIGQLIHRKGVDILLRAFAQVESQGSAFVMVAGDGPQGEELQSLAREIGIADRVRFVGFVQPSDLPHYTAASDAIVVPSRYEGWGLVVPEAMAAGLPVIASNEVSAAADLIHHAESGFLFPSEDVSALARILTEVIEDPALRDRIRSGGYKALAPERTTVAAERLVRLVCPARARDKVT